MQILGLRHDCDFLYHDEESNDVNQTLQELNFPMMADIFAGLSD